MITEHLPATVESDVPTAPAAAPPPLKVLVVDDGRNAADILAMFFEMEGHQVRVAYDGLAAIEQAASFAPQLILMDIGMPELDGLEAARRIRSEEAGQQIVMVALSGYDQNSHRLESARAGFDDHLAKPVEPNVLRALVERYRHRFETAPA
ncbi:response regulator [Luteolibacter sp. GHJ8]|uniref:Response regulator n=1 Tax=Luteolibacter rhizosphaerae TaxID=2989719 RepID=A0ABT3FYB4_9BACT|nr:response regulator [Luteolibacter rhizosphaerae]MCW1912005.1 response regulator [Luteolibacter rhizosphaerae]